MSIKRTSGPANINAASALSGTGDTARATALLNTVRAELGYQEGPNNYNKFSPHLGMQNVPWCAAFVSNMLDKSGAGAGILQNGGSASVSGLKSQFAQAGRYQEAGSYKPQPGDVIFFSASHTGIVEKVENGKVYTIEGNTSNSVARRSYSIGDPQIAGYGRTFQGNVPNDAVGAPDNLAQLAKSGHRVVRDGESLRTGVEGSAPANLRGQDLWDFFLELEKLFELLRSGKAKLSDIVAALRKAMPGLSEAQALVVGKALQENPKFAEAIQADPTILKKLAGDPKLVELLGKPGGVDEVLKRTRSPDSFQDTMEDPVGIEALPGPVAPEGTPTMLAGRMAQDIKA